TQLFQAVSVDVEANQGLATPVASRRVSNGVVQTLTRMRIQQCFKAAKPNIGQSILKRACALRSEMRTFLARLSNEKVKLISKNFGERLARLSSVGFRPDYLTPIADAAIAECVKLDGGAHKRCETLSAWSQLIAVMFTNVRDGYYEMMRRQRRVSFVLDKCNTSFFSL
ncbi:unnamed protein product, partial [Enterobius vermicularis]|uniref:GLOBIN domain-containing protein n=1 Tax=Enterobius vermicularis TaxID=51028 RepID=A0A0N4V881_ENTVE